MVDRLLISIMFLVIGALMWHTLSAYDATPSIKLTSTVGESVVPGRVNWKQQRVSCYTQDFPGGIEHMVCWFDEDENGEINGWETAVFDQWYQR